jgi:hypothetical protein
LESLLSFGSFLLSRHRLGYVPPLPGAGREMGEGARG